MLYFDERGVSRRYLVALQDGGWRWWRDSPAFSQRCTVKMKDGNNRMDARGEMNRGNGWEPDLQLTYTRVR